MSPNVKKQGKTTPPSNLYTAILALAFCTVLATAIFVACMCYFQYGAIFTIP